MSFAEIVYPACEALTKDSDQPSHQLKSDQDHLCLPIQSIEYIYSLQFPVILARKVHCMNEQADLDIHRMHMT